MKEKTQICIRFILMLLPVVMFAQASGFIVTSSNDTIPVTFVNDNKYFIDIEGASGSRIKYFNQNGDKITSRAKEINGFIVNADKRQLYFDSKDGNFLHVSTKIKMED